MFMCVCGTDWDRRLEVGYFRGEALTENLKNNVVYGMGVH